MGNPVPPQAYAVVASVGPDGSGKTALAGSLARALYARDPGSVTPPRAVAVSGMNVGVFEFRSPRRWYQYVDFESAEVESRLIASSPVAGAILLVSALDGVLEGTLESLRHAHDARAQRVVVVLSKCDAVEDPELLDLVEMEAREQLKKYHYDGDATPVVRTSAEGVLRGDRKWGECMMALVAALDSWL